MISVKKGLDATGLRSFDKSIFRVHFSQPGVYGISNVGHYFLEILNNIYTFTWCHWDLLKNSLLGYAEAKNLKTALTDVLPQFCWRSGMGDGHNVYCDESCKWHAVPSALTAAAQPCNAIYCHLHLSNQTW
jgi:hypothetical protein